MKRNKQNEKKIQQKKRLTVIGYLLVRDTTTSTKNILISVNIIINSIYF
jgi:hypothetical protein